MTHQDENFTQIKQPVPTYDLENPGDNITGTIKSLLIAIGGLILVLSIAVMLPMFLTYLSEGDTRAPSEIHATDTARKNSQNTYAK
jgi:flagellar basal body-associated protein FliL